MKISYNWLKEFIKTDLPAEEVAEMLTNCGLEVEGTEVFQSVPGGLSGIFTGQVLTCVRHPNADKLSLTTVDIGSGTALNIVCGASNVAAGQKVIVACAGTTLFPVNAESFEIKKSKIRGELSEGMICAEDEIGIGVSHEGIMVLDPETPIGMKASEFFKVEEDIIFEIGLTPNRPDAASHLGVARDLFAVLSSNSHKVSAVRLPALAELEFVNKAGTVNVKVEDHIACPRYSGINISGVKVKESPQWLQNRLLSIGLAPINNIVDITNYVLHECGQPLHAFDANIIKDRTIVVRTAKDGEKFITLDSVERKLFNDDLMISDTSEPMCIAGVFGGVNSGINATTENIFLESAYFNPTYIRRTSKRHGLKTDASFRFERGTDPNITVYALKRAAGLILEIAGGTINSEIIDIYPEEVKAHELTFRFDYLNKFAGDVIEPETVITILRSLDIEILKTEKDHLHIRIPTSKTDVTRPVDVVEEVLRIYGYNRIPFRNKLSSSLPSVTGFDRELVQNKAAEFLAANGFLELITNSLEPEDTTVDPTSEENKKVRLLNPLSQDLNSLRDDMLRSGLEIIAYNRNRKNSDLRLFEFGKTYSRNDGKYSESSRLALYLSGRKFDISWNGDKAAVDFYFAKSFVENLLSRIKIQNSSLQSRSISDKRFSYGLEFTYKEEALLTLGSVQKSQLKKYDISNEVFFADFNWDTVLKLLRKAPIRVVEVSRFPSVRRDLSMMIDGKISFAQIESIAFKTERKILQSVNLFDVYQGDKIEAGKKSYAVAFILQDEQQTLTDKHIDKTMERLMSALEREAGAQIRKS